ncbi:12078_t:CDS:2 [Cetraspora pellucida]|uniref:12078_t:CDS:1 n=1 Tax=Cetraspora pellucida TaxID=1433469 RepID=A0A9N9BS59_9GLOM|nr:12078_t:CDS:2 [Cetraspora pellucida]
MSSASEYTLTKRKKKKKKVDKKFLVKNMLTPENSKHNTRPMSSASEYTLTKRKKKKKKVDKKFLVKNMLTPEICEELYSEKKNSILDPQTFSNNLTDPTQVSFPTSTLPLDEAIKMLNTLKRESVPKTSERVPQPPYNCMPCKCTLYAIF